MNVSMPYGRSVLDGQIPENVLVKNVNSKKWRALSERQVVKAALERPMGIQKLRRVARHRSRVVIVTPDRTRGAPSHITFPLILKELRAAGVDKHSVELLVATGLHKGEASVDLKERFGNELLEDMQVIVHDSDDQQQLTSLGKLSSGTPLILNRALVESDLIVVESTIEPHFFAGFTGGSKMILPGLAGTKTILGNHGWRNIDDPRSHYGVIENPVRAEANEALHHLKKIFALNLVSNNRKRIVYANSGEIMASFTSAAEQVSRHSQIQIAERPDMVITSNGGYPLDRNLYQCIKGIAVPEEIMHERSRIIMVGECSDGAAHTGFMELLRSGTPSEIYERIRTSGTPACDQWQVQILCRILGKNPVWFVTRNELKSEVESAHLHYASTIEEALAAAKLLQGERVLLVPEGPAMILKAAAS